MRKQHSIIIQIIIGLAAFAGGVYVVLTPDFSIMRWYNIDDAFYYYKVAQNVWAGYGFTFDQINMSNGFHPLWMVVCLGVFWLSKYGLMVPLRVLVLVSAMFNAFTAVALYRFLQRYLHPCAAIGTALVWALYSPIYSVVTVHGMESSISAFFMVLLVSAAGKYLNLPSDQKPALRSLVWVGILGGLTILSRLDNVFLVGLIGVFLVLNIKRIPVLVIFDLIIVSVSVFASWIIRLGFEGVAWNAYSVYPMLIVSIFIKPVVFYFAGLYSHSSSISRAKQSARVVIAAAIASGIEYVLLFSLYKLNITPMFSNSVILIDAVLSFIFVFLVRLVFAKSNQSVKDKPVALLRNWIKQNWKPVLMQCLAYGSPIAVLVGGYMMINKIKFGSFMPVSGQIKHWWGTLPNTIYEHTDTLLSVLGLDSSGPWSLFTARLYSISERFVWKFNLQGQQPVTVTYLIFLLIVIVLFFIVMKLNRNRQAKKTFQLLIPAMLLGCLAHITYYTATGYSHTRIWYWVGEMLTLILIGSVLLDGLFSWLDQYKFTRVVMPVLLLCGLTYVVSANFISYITTIAPYNVPEEYLDDYLDETRQVELYTEKGSKIGMTGGGSVAYFIEDRTVVNLDGLINSAEYFEAMKSGTATAFLDKIPLNYVYGKPYTLLESDPYDEIFKNRLVEIGFIRGYENFTLFRYSINQ